MNYPAMAEDVAQLIARLDLRDCRILGHSMGGKVAMTLALQHPALISSMIVADIAPVAYHHDYDDLIEPILALDLESFDTRTQIDHALRPSIPEDQLRAFLLQNLSREDGAWRWRVNWQVIQQDMDYLTGFYRAAHWLGKQAAVIVYYVVPDQTTSAAPRSRLSNAISATPVSRRSTLRGTGCTPNSRLNSVGWRSSFCAVMIYREALTRFSGIIKFDSRRVGVVHDAASGISIQARKLRIPVNLTAAIQMRLRSAKNKQQIRQAVDVATGCRVQCFLAVQFHQAAFNASANGACQLNRGDGWSSAGQDEFFQRGKICIQCLDTLFKGKT